MKCLALSVLRAFETLLRLFFRLNFFHAFLTVCVCFFSSLAFYGEQVVIALVYVVRLLVL